MSYDEDQIRADDEVLSDNVTSNNSLTLLIEEIIDLEIEKSLESSVVETAQAVSHEDLDLDYSP
ncbi:16625_t:CDS:1, partial [Dentiscutata heterogama]